MCNSRSCICHNCILSCRCAGCTGAVSECRDAVRWTQAEMELDAPPKREKHKPMRDYTWRDYGISKARYNTLKAICQRGEYPSLTRSAAHTAAPEIEEYILLSVRENLSYDGLERLWELKKIKRMACCRTDFYAYRRRFYHLLDEKLKGEKQ